MLPSGNPEFLADEFCSNEQCIEKSHFLMSCKGPKCPRKIHLSCTGFPRNALNRDVDGNKLKIQWYCDACKSTLDALAASHNKNVEEMLKALHALNLKISNNTSSLDTTACHVDDMTESMNEAIKDIRASLKDVQASNGSLMSRLDNLQTTVLHSFNDKSSHMMTEMEAKMNNLLDNFTAQFSIYFGDLMKASQQREELGTLSAKVTNISDDLDSLRSSFCSGVLRHSLHEPHPPALPASSLLNEMNAVEIMSSPPNIEVGLDKTASIEKRIDQILSSPDKKEPTSEKNPVLQPPVHLASSLQNEIEVVEISSHNSQETVDRGTGHRTNDRPPVNSKTVKNRSNQAPVPKQPSTKKYPAPKPPSSQTHSIYCSVLVSNLSPDTRIKDLRDFLVDLTKENVKSFQIKSLTPKLMSNPKYRKYVVMAPDKCAKTICSLENWEDGIIIKNITKSTSASTPKVAIQPVESNPTPNNSQVKKVKASGNKTVKQDKVKQAVQAVITDDKKAGKRVAAKPKEINNKINAGEINKVQKKPHQRQLMTNELLG